MRTRPGKRLGGKPPRRTGRRMRESGSAQQELASVGGVLLALGLGLFVLGVVAGFAWSMDRQLRAGLLRQRAEAQRRPDWVELERLPAYVPAAFVAVVDPSFEALGVLRTGESGTTLSRELVRQVHLLPSGLTGEARELVMGPVLEHRTSKRELLELFLNRVHLGRTRGYEVYGIHHAAMEYFGKRAEELTLGETATLAGLLLRPRIRDPQNEVGAVGARRNEVLRVLLIGEVITPEQHAAAVAEPLGFQPGLEFFPMSRPTNWGRDTQVIQLPESLRPRPDSAAVDSAAA